MDILLLLWMSGDMGSGDYFQLPLPLLNSKSPPI